MSTYLWGVLAAIALALPVILGFVASMYVRRLERRPNPSDQPRNWKRARAGNVIGPLYQPG